MFVRLIPPKSFLIVDLNWKQIIILLQWHIVSTFFKEKNFSRRETKQLYLLFIFAVKIAAAEKRCWERSKAPSDVVDKLLRRSISAEVEVFGSCPIPCQSD